MHQDQTVVTISQRKWQSPGRARRETVSPTSHSSCKCPMNITLWEWRVRNTQESGNWQNDRHEYVRNGAQENMKHRPELQWLTANWRRPTRSGLRRYRWSHRNSPRASRDQTQGETPPPQKRNAHQWRKLSAKTRCKRGDNATGSTNETDEKKRRRARSGHS